MNTSTSIDISPAGWVAVDACTLPTAEQPLRVAEFDDLFRTSLERVERLGAGRVRLVLSGDAGLRARAEDLAAREVSCCSFFDFTIVEGRRRGESQGGVSERVEMVIAVPPGREDVLAALADLAESAGQADRAEPAESAGPADRAEPAESAGVAGAGGD
jgi:hypothetical protein